MDVHRFGNHCDERLFERRTQRCSPYDVEKLHAVCREISGNSIEFNQTTCPLVSTHSTKIYNFPYFPIDKKANYKRHKFTKTFDCVYVALHGIYFMIQFVHFVFQLYYVVVVHFYFLLVREERLSGSICSGGFLRGVVESGCGALRRTKHNQAKTAVVAAMPAQRK